MFRPSSSTAPQDIEKRLRGQAAFAASVFVVVACVLVGLLVAEPLGAITAILAAAGAGWVLMTQVVAEVAREVDTLAAAAGAGAGEVPPKVTEQGHAGAAVERVAALRLRLSAALERERAARLLAETAYREKTAFLTSVSHELRTPLNAMIGFTDVLLSELDGPITGSQREDLEHVRRSGRHLSALVRDVIDLSAAASRHLALDLQHFDLVPVLEAVVLDADMLRQQQAENAAPLQLSLPDGLPMIWGDPTRVQQIVDNLCTNALKYGGAGRIGIEAAELDGGVVVRVSDEGPGLSPERLARIFEEYERGPEADRREGVGLGLAIVRHLVRLHRGRLSVASEPGHGTTFEVWLSCDSSRRRDSGYDRTRTRAGWGTPG